MIKSFVEEYQTEMELEYNQAMLTEFSNGEVEKMLTVPYC